MGFLKRTYQSFQTLIQRPNGIILVTGPTGSGKTTSLYAALNELNRPDRKIITAEDPVEYYLSGINQVEIRHDIGLDFARMIRAMLRQAPNIILVGEMRDLETAQMGIQASLTGHLVFSTLHTNDAPSAVTRMIDMGVPAYLVASSVIAILAQRLVRVVCSEVQGTVHADAKRSWRRRAFTPEMLEGASPCQGSWLPKLPELGIPRTAGDPRADVHDSQDPRTVVREAPTEEIRKQAIQDGMITLYRDGIEKVLRGVTTLEEVYRVPSGPKTTSV